MSRGAIELTNASLEQRGRIVMCEQERLDVLAQLGVSAASLVQICGSFAGRQTDGSFEDAAFGHVGCFHGNRRRVEFAEQSLTST